MNPLADAVAHAARERRRLGTLTNTPSKRSGAEITCSNDTLSGPGAFTAEDAHSRSLLPSSASAAQIVTSRHALLMRRTNV